MLHRVIVAEQLYIWTLLFRVDCPNQVATMGEEVWCDFAGDIVGVYSKWKVHFKLGDLFFQLKNDPRHI